MSQFNLKNYSTYVPLLVILGVVMFLNNRHTDKLNREKSIEDYSAIQKYLLTDSNLGDGKKPIIWIPINYEYNARNWLSFGSRSSFELNQPYLDLTVKSIISENEDSFHICMIDDDSFAKLLPEWSIDMKTISAPVLDYIRILGLTKLIYKYGGIIVPPSFLCMKNLSEMYRVGTSGNKMFICENVDRNVTSSHHTFSPDISFMGSQKECPVVKELLDFMQRTISSDYTSQIEFLGEFDRWCDFRVRKQQINMIDGKLIGTKTMNDTTILVDDLLSNEYIDLYPQTYGIYIPAKEILNRRHYEWFARMSPTQVLESKVIISKYILLANTPKAKKGTIEPLENNPDWVKYWQVPSGFGLWGLKPIDLGNKLLSSNTQPNA